jgi:K+-sensing histidine kinase KdpD
MSLRADIQPDRSPDSLLRRWVTPITAALALVALTTALLWLIEARLQQDHLIFIYFVPTALIAIRYGSISAMVVAIVTAFAGAYFLYAPQFSFDIANPLEMMEPVLFGMLALLASQVVSGFASDRDVAARRRLTTGAPRGLAVPAAIWQRLRSGRD